MKSRIITMCLFLVFITMNAIGQTTIYPNMIGDHSVGLQTNPAQMMDQEWTILLPQYHMQYNNSAFFLKDVLMEEDNASFISFENVIPDMEDENHLNLSLGIEPIGVLYRANKFQIGLSFASSSTEYINYSKQFMEFAWYGNSQYINETITMNPIVGLNAWSELSLQLGYQLSDDINIGVRVKKLSGYYNVFTEKSKTSLFTNDEYFQLQLDNDLLINTSGFVDNKDTKVDDLLYNLTLGNENKGWAFDFGTSIAITDEWHVGIGILNVGSIEWESSIKNFVSDGVFDYNGIAVGDINTEDIVTSDAIKDTLDLIYQFDETSIGYKTDLSNRIFIQSGYKLNKTTDLNAAVVLENGSNEDNNMVAIGANHQLKEWLNLGGNVNSRNFSSLGLGANAIFDVKNVKIIAATDNLFGVFALRNSKNFGFHIGFAIDFGKNYTASAEQ